MRALVIDDSRTVRMVIKRILTAGGFEVTEAGHGQEALDVIDGGYLPHIALVDWNMPVMDGLEFIKAVRARADLRDVTLMMVTTEGERPQIVRALASGAHEYLIKPFTEDALMAKLDLLGIRPGMEVTA